MAQVEYPSDIYYAEPHWTDLIPPIVALLIAVPFLIWLIQYCIRAASQQKQCLDQSITAVDVTRDGIQITEQAIQASRESIEVTRQAIELQRETNRLLEELNENLRNQ